VCAVFERADFGPKAIGISSLIKHSDGTVFFASQAAPLVNPEKRTRILVNLSSL
jgi:hypothetical protein